MLTGGRSGRRGAVAVEMAITLPVLVTLFLGGFDLVSAVTAWRSTRTASIAIAEVATNLAVQEPTANNPNGNNSLTATQAWDASTAVFAYLAGLKSTRNTSAYAVTLSAVAFTVATGSQCANASCVCVTTTTATGATANAISSTNNTGSNGTSSTTCYIANLAWSVALTNVPNAAGVFSQTRGTNGCGVLKPVAPGTASTLTTLPVGMYGPFSLLVADVSYQYRPTFTTFVTGNITFLESAYLTPRIGTINNGVAPYVQYTPNTSPPVCSPYV